MYEVAASVASAGSDSLLMALITMEGIAGILLLVGPCLLAFGRAYSATRLSWGTLLFYLAGVDVLAFYYMQFLAIILVAVQFLALWGVRYYRRRQFASGPAT